ncbi:hypothetical protein [Limnoraphis robusta]|uniref:hypothetical protein n=1 Tax=Limnoraphis robusta TaxID=1118279 RepID=UPI002B2072E6|nr:hypothetical protein [Limnoraphis robusta]MEA5498025.1 hypothetical protein [Limnoraphis robusta BA-68 BA1]
MEALTHDEIWGAASHHGAIAIAESPRKSNHSFTGFCTDVFFDDADCMNRFRSIVESLTGIFLAVSYEQDYARVRVPVEPPF